MFAGQLTRYTTRHTQISYSLAYQCPQVNLQPTRPDTPRSATASHINVRRSTYPLHGQTHQDQLQPRISMFAGQLTRYTTRHTQISYSLAYQCPQVNLQTTRPDTPRSATASHINIRGLTYVLHHQTHQYQRKPRISKSAV
jgi:transcriptional regulator of nitric oxide reductase